MVLPITEVSTSDLDAKRVGDVIVITVCDGPGGSDRSNFIRSSTLLNSTGQSPV